jgi:uncharacterized coiled-coil DUF342 family protein
VLYVITESEARKMTDNVIMVILGFIGALLVALKPILDLNTNITELKVSIDAFKESVDKLDNRITEHGKEIDKLKESVANHEARITNLER